VNISDDMCIDKLRPDGPREPKPRGGGGSLSFASAGFDSQFAATITYYYACRDKMRPEWAARPPQGGQGGREYLCQGDRIKLQQQLFVKYFAINCDFFEVARDAAFGWRSPAIRVTSQAAPAEQNCRLHNIIYKSLRQDAVLYNRAGRSLAQRGPLFAFPAGFDPHVNCVLQQIVTSSKPREPQPPAGGGPLCSPPQAALRKTRSTLAYSYI